MPDDAAGEAAALALRRLSSADLDLLGRDELTGVLEDIERLTNRLAGYRFEVLGALDALSRSGVAPDAAPHQTLRDAAGISEREARRLVRVAANAREHPQVLEALSGGEINPAQAEAISDARVPEEVRAGLVAAAGAEDTDTTRRRVREAESCQQTASERFERQRAARGAGWGREHDGMLKLWARFDPETGARVEAALEQIRRAYWQHDKRQQRGRRTPAQRDADALAYAVAGITLTDADARVVDKLLARAAGCGSAASRRSNSGRTRPSDAGAEQTADGRPRAQHPGAGRPEVEASAGRPGVEPGTGRPEVDESSIGELAGGEAGSDLPWGGPRLPPTQISVLIGLDALRGQTDEVGVTDAGTELASETVRRLACDAEIIPICLGGPGGSADIGRARRTVPLRLRRLLIARDRHCKWPGCNAPPSRCDAHHIVHWAERGPTNLDNLLLLCHVHHQHLHEHGYELKAQPDGSWFPIRAHDQRPSERQQRAAARSRRPRAP